MNNYQHKGFTLIELMIVVAIISILAAIAIPSYKEHVAQGRRADAKVQLLSAQQWMERMYSERYSYSPQDLGSGMTIQTVLAQQVFASSPRAGAGASISYNITLSAVDNNSYTLIATRTGSMVNDICGNFTLNNIGQKLIAAGTFNTYTTLDDAVKNCWS